MKNEFKNGIEPAKHGICTDIGRDAKQVKKLTPPQFQTELIDFTNKNIFWGQALQKVERGLR